MTTDDIASLERIVRERMGDRDGVRAVVEELAYRGDGRVSEAERDASCGLGADIAVVHDGTIRFTDATVRAYLAACHLRREHPVGPRWREPGTWRYLAPQHTWPWPDVEMRLFLAALWHATAPAAVDRRLRRLLRARHRDPNLRFVVELLRRNLIPGGDLRSRTADLLRGVLHDGGQEEATWRAMAECLHLLDPALARTELEKMLETSDPDFPQVRRVDAAEELAKHDPARGADGLRNVAHSLTGPPPGRLDAAVRIKHLDSELGARTFRVLAYDPKMQDLRVDAALQEGSPDLLRDLVEPAHGLPDGGRLRLADTLLRLDVDAGLEALDRITETAADERTPLRVAEIMRPHRPEQAMRQAYDLAWPTGRTVGGGLRLDAVLLIGTFDPARKVPELHRLSGDRSVKEQKVRVRAATIIVKDGGPPTALIELSEDSTLRREYLVEVADTLAPIEPAAAARAYVAVAKQYPPNGSERPKYLRKANKCHPAATVDEITRYVKNAHAPAKNRLELVEAVAPSLDQRRRIDLFSVLARDRNTPIAEKAARKLIHIEPLTGRRLLGDLATRPGWDHAARLKAAEDAGSHGKAALIDLANKGRPPTLRLQAAISLRDFDRPACEKALRRLAETRHIGHVRIDAALALPKRDVAKALRAIAEDPREKQATRTDAQRELDKRHRGKA